MKQKDELYAKEDFTEEDGILASELEGEFAEMNGWEVESDASKLIQGLGLSNDLLNSVMSSLSGDEKVKVLLARALFGNPEIILLDEPTNHLDIEAVNWLEDFIMDYEGTVIVVSHDRHFLNMVCTNIVDIDYGKINSYVGNYEFWYESSQLVAQLVKQQNKKNEDRIKELQTFITRFSANKSKSKQATSRRKLIDKLSVEDMPASTRRYPFVNFTIDRECGKEILTVEGISHTVDGVKVLNDVSFRINFEDKIALTGDEIATTTLLKILAGEIEPDAGSFKWGVSTTQSYFPKDNTEYFDGNKDSILNWLKQYSSDDSESFLRGFLGRMLFSGDDVLKAVNVLSGGEKVRCMLSRMMMSNANVIMLDGPTNHLDLESITALNNGLIAYKSNIILTTHDHEILQTVCNRIIEIRETGVLDKPCSYDEFIEFKKEQNIV